MCAKCKGIIDIKMSLWLVIFVHSLFGGFMHSKQWRSQDLNVEAHKGWSVTRDVLSPPEKSLEVAQAPN